MIILKKLLLLFFLVTLIPAAAHSSSNEFPLRQKFPETTPISVEEVRNGFDNYTIIDVRSKFEFDTIHINDSTNIKVADLFFKKNLAKKISKDTKVVFYCNGHTCAKSYKAARAAIQDGYNNTFVLDAGIFEWAQTNPDKTTFLGHSPADVTQLMASKEEFASINLPFEEFKKNAALQNTILIDIRDSFQKTKESDRSVKIRLPEMPAKSKNISLDKFMNIIKNKGYINQTLLVYDAAGKQVKWLSYHLKAAGYTSYYFLKGGVHEVTGVSSN